MGINSAESSLELDLLCTVPDLECGKLITAVPGPTQETVFEPVGGHHWWLVVKEGVSHLPCTRTRGSDPKPAIQTTNPEAQKHEWYPMERAPKVPGLGPGRLQTFLFRSP